MKVMCTHVVLLIQYYFIEIRHIPYGIEFIFMSISDAHSGGRSGKGRVLSVDRKKNHFRDVASGL